MYYRPDAFEEPDRFTKFTIPYWLFTTPDFFIIHPYNELMRYPITIITA